MGNTHANVKEVTISPTKAASIIKRNAAVLKSNPNLHNRHVSSTVVARYADDMKNGRWSFNGETVKIAADGWIIDGQHRLAACVQADVPFRTLFVENLDRDTFASVDIGKIRTGANLLTISGKANSAVLASALSHLWRWERGDGKQFVDWNQSPSKPTLFEILERHPQIEDFVGKTHGLSKLMSHGLAAVLWYLFAKRDEAMAELFFGVLQTGLNMNKTDPVYILRERLIRDRGQRPVPPTSVTADLVMRAWTATRKGQKLTKLQLPPEGKHGKRGTYSV